MKKGAANDRIDLILVDTRATNFEHDSRKCAGGTCPNIWRRIRQAVVSEMVLPDLDISSVAIRDRSRTLKSNQPSKPICKFTNAGTYDRTCRVSIR